MWAYDCKSKIRCISINDDKILVGCLNGWVHLFDNLKHIWTKKLTSTYYRDPYTDVNITSLDIYGKNVAVGTDFMDGKVYLFSEDGRLRWHRQFITIVGCWERPDDIVAISMSDEIVAVGSEWMNSYLHILEIDGDLIDERELDGSIKDIQVKDDMIIVGTSSHLYINERKMMLPTSKIFVDKDDIFVSSSDCFYALDVDGNIKWGFKVENPIFSVSDDTIAVAGNTLLLLSKDGEKLWEMKIRKPVCLHCKDESIYAGYHGHIEIIESGIVIDRIKVEGTPVHMGKYVVCVKDKTLIAYNEYAL